MHAHMHSHAEYALKKTDKTMFMGRTITVEYCQNTVRRPKLLLLLLLSASRGGRAGGRVLPMPSPPCGRAAGVRC